MLVSTDNATVLVVIYIIAHSTTLPLKSLAGHNGSIMLLDSLEVRKGSQLKNAIQHAPEPASVPMMGASFHVYWVVASWKAKFSMMTPARGSATPGQSIRRRSLGVRCNGAAFLGNTTKAMTINKAPLGGLGRSQQERRNKL